jgi:NAD(P)-dependent dehydrogenase (short-subunit alcohol dehydrogenase family)
VEIERYTAGLLQLATAYVMLADPLSSYVSGATIPVTGGRPFL